jgi:hypothetical protein
LAGYFEDDDVLDQSLTQGSRTSIVPRVSPRARPFLTHDWQLGFAACGIRKGDSIYHLIEPRVALVVDISKAEKKGAVAKGELANYIRGRALVMKLHELSEYDFMADNHIWMIHPFREEWLSQVRFIYETESAHARTEALPFTMFLEQWRRLEW